MAKAIVGARKSSRAAKEESSDLGNEASNPLFGIFSADTINNVQAVLRYLSEVEEFPQEVALSESALWGRSLILRNSEAALDFAVKQAMTEREAVK